jgi:hypothetical protein
MRFPVLFFCIGTFLAKVDSSPAGVLSSRSPQPKLPSDLQNVQLRDKYIREGLAKLHPAIKNFSTKTIRDIFLECLDKNDFSTDDSMTAASKPKCMALGIFPPSSLKLEPITDEIIRLVSGQLNTRSAGRIEMDQMFKEPAQLEKRIVDIWSALMNDGYMLAKASTASQTSPIHKAMQNIGNKVTTLRKRTSTLTRRTIEALYFRQAECPHDNVELCREEFDRDMRAYGHDPYYRRRRRHKHPHGPPPEYGTSGY